MKWFVRQELSSIIPQILPKLSVTAPLWQEKEWSCVKWGTDAQRKPVCLIRIWSVFTCTYFFWIPFSTRQVCVQISCVLHFIRVIVNSLVTLRLYLKSETSLVSWSETATIAMACGPNSSSLPSCHRLSVCAESHSTLFLCCNLPSVLRKVEEGAQTGPDWKMIILTHAEIFQRKIWNRALPRYLLVHFFWKAALSSP